MKLYIYVLDLVAQNELLQKYSLTKLLDKYLSGDINPLNGSQYCTWRILEFTKKTAWQITHAEATTSFASVVDKLTKDCIL